MARIFLVRHGEVAGNSGERRTFAGWDDLPLTPRGLEQAGAVAARLKREPLRAVYASDLQRARITGQIIAAAHGLSVQPEFALREVSYGKWEGLSEDDIARDWQELWEKRVADPFNVAPPGGESYADLWRRWQPAWENILKAHPNEDVAIVGHNGSLRVLLCHLLGAPLSNARRLRVGNCSLSCVEIEVPQGKLAAPPAVVAYVNDTSHLPGI